MVYFFSCLFLLQNQIQENVFLSQFNFYLFFNMFFNGINYNVSQVNGQLICEDVKGLFPNTAEVFLVFFSFFKFLCGPKFLSSHTLGYYRSLIVRPQKSCDLILFLTYVCQHFAWRRGSKEMLSF